MERDEVIRKMISRHWLILILSVSLLLAMVVMTMLLVLVSNQFIVEIRMTGDPAVTLEFGQVYEETGADAVLRGSGMFAEGIDLDVQVDGTVNGYALGTYEITYTARYGPWSGSAVRTVEVVDTTPPEITLFTNDEKLTQPGQAYREEGFLAIDNCDGDLTRQVEAVEADGIVTYAVTDASGNSAVVTRQIRYAEASE